MEINIDNIIKNISDTVDSHCIGEGKYSRWVWQNDHNNRDLGVNEYGCADAANILYTIGKFPEENERRVAWINALQSMQNSQTGLFTEPTHHSIHTTAHCIAALELFDAKPIYPLTELMKYSTKEGLRNLLENLCWENNPWDASHQGAGIYASLVLTDSVTADWEEFYFQWLWNNVDEKTGFWRKDSIDKGNVPLFHHLAGSFHYMFNHEYARRPIKYPQRIIDTCIDMYKNDNLNENFGNNIGFAEIDWIYCITRANRQTSYRFYECKRILEEFAEKFIEYLSGLNVKNNDAFNDLHALFGTVCALAELQQAMPGMIKTKKPLKLVLDRRPFI